jgi:queuine tRNA-ribosyltransferase
VKLEISATDGRARAAHVTTSRGTYDTPIFMPVGTRGTVRMVDTADLDALGADIILANTYHLMLRPGAEVVEALGGLHRFEGWDGHILTDSGGFQVFSLDPAVDDEGVIFRSAYDGSRHRLTPERAVAIQEQLGGDIAMVLDICLSLPAGRDEVRHAGERTLDWAARSRAVHRRADQAQFGIVQGGADVELRAEFAKRTVDIGFDGYGIGGLSVGETREEMLAALEPAVRELPADAPRYLMGVGDPVGIVEAVALGVDQFDCVQPTRLARHGTALTSTGRVHLKRAEHVKDDAPIDADCPCAVCRRWSRAYIRHLFAVGEPTAARLVTRHNLAWMLAFMDRIRAAIAAGTLHALRAEVRTNWPSTTLTPS